MDIICWIAWLSFFVSIFCYLLLLNVNFDSYRTIYLYKLLFLKRKCHHHTYREILRLNLKWNNLYAKLWNEAIKKTKFSLLRVNLLWWKFIDTVNILRRLAKIGFKPYSTKMPRKSGWITSWRIIGNGYNSITPLYRHWIRSKFRKLYKGWRGLMGEKNQGILYASFPDSSYSNLTHTAWRIYFPILR